MYANCVFHTPLMCGIRLVDNTCACGDGLHTGVVHIAGRQAGKDGWRSFECDVYLRLDSGATR